MFRDLHFLASVHMGFKKRVSKDQDDKKAHKLDCSCSAYTADRQPTVQKQYSTLA